jgi:glucosamine--fructose-6-phosphate aminotransferase (isomerizing)
MEYDLTGGAACIASNSGKTREGLRLIRKLKNGGVPTVGIVANAGTPIVEEADYGIVLSCGDEEAVAATKSVVEQALVYQRIFSCINGYSTADTEALSRGVAEVLALQPPQEVIGALADAGTLLWAGRNDGVAEELTLKSNEIARKRSDFLEGTYAVHGIEEVLSSADTVILVEPFEEEEEKFRQVLVDGVGLRVVAIASRETSFPTFRIPRLEGHSEYLQLAAGWSLLVEVGITLGINLDKPVRARKVGNEAEA